jgi:cell division septation protein DedD
VTNQAAPAQAAPAPAATAPRQAATPAAPKAAPTRNGGPISLDPQGEPAVAPATRTRTAAAPPIATRAAPETTESTLDGFMVQLSSQKSEAEAQSSFRSLQAKFPSELGGLAPVVRRADLGSKGVFYRTMVGPFASAQEASQFCANYKAAGGQCVVPNN